MTPYIGYIKMRIERGRFAGIIYRFGEIDWHKLHPSSNIQTIGTDCVSWGLQVYKSKISQYIAHLYKKNHLSLDLHNKRLLGRISRLLWFAADRKFTAIDDFNSLRYTLDTPFLFIHRRRWLTFFFLSIMCSFSYKRLSLFWVFFSRSPSVLS